MKKVSIITVSIIIVLVLCAGVIPHLKKPVTEEKNIVDFHTWFFTSGVPNNAIIVNYPDEKAICECSTDYGCFGFSIGDPTVITVKPGEEFYWRIDRPETTKAFVSIVIKIDKHIVGYAVIKIVNKEDYVISHMAVPSVVKSVVFPKVNGRFQRITKKQTEKEIQKIIEEN